MPKLNSHVLNGHGADKLVGLDHLRALAITLVIFFHYQFFEHPAWEPTVSDFGWTGVDLFFVLSGFLIASQLFANVDKGKGVNLKEFYLKRFFRIIPAYLTMVILYNLFPILHERSEIDALWKYLTFTLNLSLDPRQFGTFTHAWSLCVEEQFYLLFPLAIVLFSFFKIGKYTVYTILALFIGGFFLRQLSWDHSVAMHVSEGEFKAVWTKYVYYPTYNRLDGLLVGIGLAALFTFYPKVKALADKYSNLVLLTGIALIICAYFICLERVSYNATIWGFPLIAIAFGFIVAAAVCPSCILYRFKSSFTAHLATLSYSLYLVHKMMIHVTQEGLGALGLDKTGNLMMLLSFAASVMGALLMRNLVEKPFMKLRDKVLKKHRTKKTVVVAEAEVAV